LGGDITHRCSLKPFVPKQLKGTFQNGVASQFAFLGLFGVLEHVQMFAQPDVYVKDNIEPVQLRS
jgi:hypothetical protein